MRNGRVNLAGLSEPVLILASQAGDKAAFGELVQRQQGRLRALLRRLCGNPAEADDLAQEVFMRIWDRIGDLRDPQAFGGWIRRIAVMRFMQVRRRAGLDMDAAADIAGEQADAPSPERDAGARLDLERMLAVLSPPERLCVALNLGEGMSHGEIEQVTGLKLGTIKSHIARGLAKLRGRFGGDNG